MRTRGRLFRVARRAWWALPARVRDGLRPVLVPAGGARSPLPRRRGPAPAARAPRPVPRVEASVSVVVPTLNAGPLFARVLAALRSQRGLGQVELVVVDSGSTDGTRELAAAAGARVLEIDPADFGHGRTRNLGAEAAAGDVLVMLVQDAVPLGADALRTLAAELLADERCAAVSARQVPRTDADLFAAFVCCTHDAVMWGSAERAAERPPSRRSPLERRALAAVDDVCAALRRAAWAELRFADVEFAEDLELGARAVAAGWTVRQSAAAAVAHSHTRDAAYHFRRAVADRAHVAPLFGDVRSSAVEPAAAHRALERVQGALDRLDGAARPLGPLLRALRAELPAAAAVAPRGELAVLAAALPGHANGADTDRAARRVVEELARLLAWPPLADFARGQAAVEGAELATFVAKLAATVVGGAVDAGARLEPLLEGAARA